MEKSMETWILTHESILHDLAYLNRSKTLFSLIAATVYITLEGALRTLVQELPETFEVKVPGPCKGFIYFLSLKEPPSTKGGLH